jgi:starch synthase
MVHESVTKNDVRQKILLAASEVVGFAKTGGLADVAGSLPRALTERGHECIVVLPLYRCARDSKMRPSPTDLTVTVPIGQRSVSGRLWRAALPDSQVTVYLIEQADYFDRDDPGKGRGLYQFTLPGGQKRDYPDNCERFIFFSRALLEAMRLLAFWPDVLHLNDWQTGLVPVYLREVYRGQPGYDAVRTIFTVHNLAYQGQFWHWDMLLTGLDWQLFNYRQIEFYGQLNFLKAGLVFSDVISTVSPTYAKEIQSAQFAYGLEGVLAERRERLFGIVNGVDYGIWNPKADAHIAARYDETDVAQKKPLCKAALQRRFGLSLEPRTPLLAMIARLVEQKGIDLLGRIAESLLQKGAQIVVLGDGDPAYHRMLTDLHNRNTKKVGIAFTFDEVLAHQIEAGADIYLMPSQFEPAGLNQLYSIKYGTVPVVRATGGLADTVTDCTPETLAAGRATGFAFTNYTPTAFQGAVQRALSMYHDSQDLWLQLMRNGMRQDWSWARSALEYEKLYNLVRGL